MSIETFRAKAKHDRVIRDAVARAAGPGLIAMIEGGQRLNDLDGLDYRALGNDNVFHLVQIIADYRYLQPVGSVERARAVAVLACGHGYNLTDSCPMCDNNRPPTPGCLPLIALVPRPTEDGES